MIELLLVALAGFGFGILYFGWYKRMLFSMPLMELTLSRLLLLRLLRAFLLLVFAGSLSICFGLTTLMALPGIYLARLVLVSTTGGVADHESSFLS